ncbi:MAG: hypothetical protein AAF656_00560 [Planctomycetota bacterium]
MSAETKDAVLDAPETAKRENGSRDPVMRDAGEVVGNGNGPSSPVVPLFKTAHQKIVTLARLDEQLATMLEQRVALQTEIRSIRGQINSEFDRVLEEADGTSQRLLDEINRTT